MTSQQNTGTHPFYIGMYIHIYTHIYVHKYTSQKECLHIFWVKHSWPNQNSQPDLWMHDHPAWHNSGVQKNRGGEANQQNSCHSCYGYYCCLCFFFIFVIIGFELLGLQTCAGGCSSGVDGVVYHVHCWTYNFKWDCQAVAPRICWRSKRANRCLSLSKTRGLSLRMFEACWTMPWNARNTRYTRGARIACD